MSDPGAFHRGPGRKLSAQTKNRRKRAADKCHQRGESLSKKGRFGDAIQEHKRALNLLERQRDVIGCGIAHRLIGECFLELGKWKSSLKHHRAFLELAQSVGNYADQQRAWILIGRSYLLRHRSDQSGEALHQAQKGFERSLEILNEKLEGTTGHRVSTKSLKMMRAGVYLNLGIVGNLLKDTERSMEHIRQSIAVAEENHLFADLHRANYYLASIHQVDGEYTRALQRLEIAQENARKASLSAEESDCLASMGEIHLMCGDFTTASLRLKEALSLAPLAHRDRVKVKKLLQKAMKGVKLQESVIKTLPEQYCWRMKFYEKLGDLCCRVMGYQKGLDYYQKQLECAEILKRPDEEMAMIHFSLGRTYYDLKDYKQAINHYETELAFQKDRPREACKTWLHIARAKQQDGAEYTDLAQCYQNALQHATLAQEPRLQGKVQKELRKCQQNLNNPSGLEEGVSTESEEGTESGEGTDSDEGMESEEDTIIEESTENEGGTEMENADGPDEARVSGSYVLNRKVWKRNCKGETNLHRACIRGSFTLTSSLIEQGHPLTVRDNAGWTPLHEACNHGHLEIVRLLLDSGAPVNCTGDAGCGGVSPLHDALANGWLDIAKLLIDRGACLTVRDNEGQLPVDCLRRWKRDLKLEPSPETSEKCAAILSILERASAHSDSTTQTHAGQDVNPPTQHLRGDPYSSECSPLTSSLDSPDSTFTPRHWQSGDRGEGSGRSAGPSRLKAQRRGRLTRSKRRQPAPPSKPAIPRPVSSTAGSRWSSEEDDDFLPSSFKKQFVRGQSSPADPMDSKVSSGSQSSKLPSISVGQREGLTDHTATTTSKPSQSAMRTKTSSPKPSQSATSTKTSSPKPSQSSMSAKKPSGNTNQSSPNSSQSSASTTLSFEDQADWSAIGSLPRVTALPSKVSDWPDGDSLEDDWLEVNRSQSKEALSGVGHGVPSALGAGTQGNRPGPAETGGNLLGYRTADVSTQSDARRASFQTPRSWMRETPTCPQRSGPSRAQPSGQSSLPPSSPATPFRVKVQVKDKLFLIAVPSSDPGSYTISWLAKQAETRYSGECGVRPQLTLSADGALLSPHDPVIHLLHDNEEIVAEVVSWDLPPIAVRYKRACDSLALAEDPSMSKILQLQEDGSSIDLSNLSLNKQQLTPILRALKLQTSTRQLCLAANRLGDGAMEELLASLVTMPKLTLLDLSSNQITHEGLKKLSEACTASREPPFPGLEELNLSLNPLGDGSSQLIASLIRSCPVLSTLKLQACGLSARFLQNFELSCTMRGSRHLKTLILSDNELGIRGVQPLLRNLAHDVVSHLEISSVLRNQEARPLMELLVKYLTQTGCILTHLNLSKNSLTDDSIRDFSRCLTSVPSLVFLDLSQNPGISSHGVKILLAALAERDSWMEVLDLSGCSVHQDDIESETAGWNLGDLRL